MPNIAERVARLSPNQLAVLQGTVARTIPRWPGGGRRLIAYVVRSPYDPSVAALSERELRAYLQQYLPDPMIPSRFVMLEQLPLTSTGKIDRRALPPPDAPAATPPRAFTEPATAVEKRLAAIWVEVLGTARVGLHENFFELSGHSLLAAQVVARAREAFAIDLPMQAIFERPTVAALAELIEQTGGTPRDEIFL
jgi:acyl carrier protein